MKKKIVRFGALLLITVLWSIVCSAEEAEDFSTVLSKIMMGTYDYATVSSGSMDPAIKAGDTVAFNKNAYRKADPERGDIVLYQYPIDKAL